MFFFFASLFFHAVSQCYGGCAEVDSLTEAVAGEGFLLGCISCKIREEVPAQATVDWHFKPLGEEEFMHVSSPNCEIWLGLWMQKVSHLLPCALWSNFETVPSSWIVPQMEVHFSRPIFFYLFTFSKSLTVFCFFTSLHLSFVLCQLSMNFWKLDSSC